MNTFKKKLVIYTFWAQHMTAESEYACVAQKAKDLLLEIAIKGKYQRREEDKKAPVIAVFAQHLLGIYSADKTNDIQHKLWPSLIAPSVTKHLSEANFYQFQKVILDNGTSNLKQTAQILEFLNMVIDFGNSSLLWHLPFFDTLKQIPRPINPLGTPESWQNYLYATEFKNLHLKFIRDELHTLNLSDEIKLGVLVTDLLFQSFVLNKMQLIMLIKQLPDEDNFHYQNKRLFFNVPVDDFNPNRRVFISRITELLIYRLTPHDLIRTLVEKKVQHQHFENKCSPNTVNSHKSKHKLFASALLKSVSTYTKQLGIPQHLMPTSLFGICRLAELGLFDTLAPVILHNTAGTLKSHCLKTSTLEKLYAVSIIDQRLLYESEPKTLSEKPYYRSYGLSQVRKVFNHPSRKADPKTLHAKILGEANRIYGLTPNLQYLLDWGLSQLKVLPGKNRFDISPTKILGKLDSIARHILGVFHERDLLKTSSVERANLFLEVIDQAISDRNVNTIQYNLRTFNSWLEKNKKAPPIYDKTEVFGDPKLTDMTVNSNLFTFDAYERVREHLKNLQKDLLDEEQKNRYAMMDLMLILGFKCGLRSTEAFKIKVSDYIYCANFPILVIRESYDRELKTTSAKRSLELANLLTNDEIDVINQRFFKLMQEIERKSMREQQKLKEALYLFGKTSNPSKTPAIQYIKHPLMRFIHESSQDQTLNFHHLRHSFASWHFLSACVAELDLKLKDTFLAFPKTQQWLECAQERKLALLPTTQKSKKAPFWITIKMGHANFKTTFEHYIHTSDLVIMMIQDQLAEKFNSQFWANLSGANDSYLRKKKTEKIAYACQYVAPKALKQRIKQQLKAHQSAVFKSEPILSSPPKLETLSATWVEQMTTYQDLAQLDNRDRLSRKQRRIEKFFMGNPNYRLRTLNKSEKFVFDSLAKKLESLSGGDLSQVKQLAPEIKICLDLFAKCLTPESNDLTTLKPQRSYQLLATDLQQALMLKNLIDQLELKFIILIHLKKPKKTSDNDKNHEDVNYWRTGLELNPMQIKLQTSYPSRPGAHSRIEIRVVNDKNRKLHAFYYLMSTLSVFHCLN